MNDVNLVSGSKDHWPRQLRKFGRRFARFSIGVIAGLANRLGLSLSGHIANGILRAYETDRSHRIDVD